MSFQYVCEDGVTVVRRLCGAVLGSPDGVIACMRRITKRGRQETRLWRTSGLQRPVIATVAVRMVHSTPQGASDVE